MATGELTSRERAELDQVIRAAEESCRVEFSVFLGRAGNQPRRFAEQLHQNLVAPDRSLLVMVDEESRAIEIVTGEHVRRELTDDEVATAIEAMRSHFVDGQLLRGLKVGVTMLAELSLN